MALVAQTNQPHSQECSTHAPCVCPQAGGAGGGGRGGEGDEKEHDPEGVGGRAGPSSSPLLQFHCGSPSSCHCIRGASSVQTPAIVVGMASPPAERTCAAIFRQFPGLGCPRCVHVEMRQNERAQSGSGVVNDAGRPELQPPSHPKSPTTLPLGPSTQPTPITEERKNCQTRKMMQAQKKFFLIPRQWDTFADN